MTQRTNEPASESDLLLRDTALSILRRHGYTAGDLDFLLYEGQAGTPGDDDPEMEEAIGILGNLRQRGIAIS